MPEGLWTEIHLEPGDDAPVRVSVRLVWVAPDLNIAQQFITAMLRHAQAQAHALSLEPGPSDG